VAIHHNLELATHYLGRLLRDFRGTPLLAVAAYNAGPHAVSRWLESGEALPADVFAARIPYDETREYVYRVLNNYARYRYLSHGPGAVGAPSPALPQGVRASSDAY
jgi:soluble lytic murein transglycosylase